MNKEINLESIVIEIMTTPTFYAIITFKIFFPKEAEELSIYLKANKVKGESVNDSITYDWIRQKLQLRILPSSDIANPDDAFREMIKALTYRTLNLPDYISPNLVKARH